MNSVVTVQIEIIELIKNKYSLNFLFHLKFTNELIIPLIDRIVVKITVNMALK